MRRIRSPCCARAASGQRTAGAAAAPPISVMNSRRFIRSPRRRAISLHLPLKGGGRRRRRRVGVRREAVPNAHASMTPSLTLPLSGGGKTARAGSGQPRFEFRMIDRERSIRHVTLCGGCRLLSRLAASSVASLRDAIRRLNGTGAEYAFAFAPPHDSPSFASASRSACAARRRSSADIRSGSTSKRRCGVAGARAFAGSNLRPTTA